MLYSLALLLLTGFFAGKISAWLKLPELLGMLLTGIILGPYMFNLVAQDLLDVAQALRMFALLIILLRAGLGLSKDSLVKVGRVAFNLSWIPCIFEGLTVMVMAVLLLKFSWIEGGLLGFILAAVSPAVVVPSMIALKEQGYGENKEISTMILAGASVDDVYAITIFTTFLSLALQESTNVLLQVSWIPFSIVAGIIGGLLVGLGLLRLYKVSFLHNKDTEKLLLLLGIGVLYYSLGDWLGIASLLGVMAIGVILRHKDMDSALKLAAQLARIWIFAQIILFTLVGAEVNIGVALAAGVTGLAIIIIGLLGRSLGVWIATFGTNLNAKERLFCMIAYLPKATVQAAIGGIPLAMGMESGAIILAISVLAILITAPLGAIGIKLGAPILLVKE